MKLDNLNDLLVDLIDKIKIIKNHNILDEWYLLDVNDEQLEIEVKKDIDLILMVSNDTNITSLTEEIIPILVRFIKKNKLFISCFPFRKEEFTKTNKSRFIKNVENYGRKIKTEKSN